MYITSDSATSHSGIHSSVISGQVGKDGEVHPLALGGAECMCGKWETYLNVCSYRMTLDYGTTTKLKIVELFMYLFAF